MSYSLGNTPCTYRCTASQQLRSGSVPVASNSWEAAANACTKLASSELAGELADPVDAELEDMVLEEHADLPTGRTQARWSPIMTKLLHLRPTLVPLLVTATLGWLPPAGQAQAIHRDGCPLLVPASQAGLQPMRLQPNQVAEKNARGCLSPFDAIYGPDGCPKKLCGPDAGLIQLPLP
jgi:hypothetical protein